METVPANRLVTIHGKIRTRREHFEASDQFRRPVTVPKLGNFFHAGLSQVRNPVLYPGDR